VTLPAFGFKKTVNAKFALANRWAIRMKLKKGIWQASRYREVKSIEPRRTSGKPEAGCLDPTAGILETIASQQRDGCSFEMVSQTESETVLAGGAGRSEVKGPPTLAS
jgi:hypothetical protein